MTLEPLFVGYSTRNRAFSSEFFEYAGKLAMRDFHGLAIAIFDVPYAYNDAAARGASSPSPGEIARARLIGDERARMVRRVLGRMATLKFQIWRWDDLDSPTAQVFRLELVEGLARDPVLAAALAEDAARWARGAGQPYRPELLGFQISELPVLIDIYYRRKYLTDLYPGELSSFFFDLEDGRWSKTLPAATAVATQARLSCISPASADLSSVA